MLSMRLGVDSDYPIFRPQEAIFWLLHLPGYGREDIM
jgi:hypothetical protein